MTAYYTKSGAGAADFAQSFAYSLGNKMVPVRSDAGTNFAVARRWVWECTTAGTSAAANPTWPASVTQDVTTVTSNTAIFTARRPGYSSGTTANWAFATIYCDYMLANTAAAGDVFYVSNNHAETVAIAGYDFTTSAVQNAPVRIFCVDDGAAPPTTLATTATITLNLAGTTQFFGTVGYCHVYGISVFAGTGATLGQILLGSSNAISIWESCNFYLVGANSSARIGLSSTSGIDVRWINCGVRFAHAQQAITASSMSFQWIGGSVLAGGTSPNSVVQSGSGRVILENLDLSNCGSAVNLTAQGTATTQPWLVRNIKVPASWSGSVNSSTPTLSSSVTAINHDNAGTNYKYERETAYGNIFHEIVLIRTGGATDGTTPISWKFVTNTVGGGLFPLSALESTEILVMNTTTGSARTYTIEILRDSVTALNNDEIWIEAKYLSATGSPLGALVSSAKTNPLATGTAYTSSSETWTTTGMANPNKQKMSVTFTPQLAGFVMVLVKLAKVSTTVYVDPMITVS